VGVTTEPPDNLIRLGHELAVQFIASLAFECASLGNLCASRSKGLVGDGIPTSVVQGGRRMELSHDGTRPLLYRELLNTGASTARVKFSCLAADSITLFCGYVQSLFRFSDTRASLPSRAHSAATPSFVSALSVQHECGQPLLIYAA
jgi:hypothetical protein